MDSISKVAIAIAASGAMISLALYLGMTYQTREAVNACIYNLKASGLYNTAGEPKLRQECAQAMLYGRR